MKLPLHMQFTMNHVITFTSVVTVVSLADWWMVILMIPLGLFFSFPFFCHRSCHFSLHLDSFHSTVIIYSIRQKRYRKAVIQVRRMEGVTRSPIYVHYDNTLSGLASIRAYKCIPRFEDEFMTCIDENARMFQSIFLLTQWYAERLDWLGSLTQGVTVASLMAGKYLTSLDVGLASLAVSNMAQITQALSGISRNVAEVEQSLQSVERVLEYSDVEQEEDAGIAKCQVDDSWPQSGSIVFDHVSARYRPFVIHSIIIVNVFLVSSPCVSCFLFDSELPLVLKDLTCIIKSGERIGVVGRTGSGKSTLLQVLFRMINAASGTITIDDVDTSVIPLSRLRSKMSIIPQDPMLFNGLFLPFLHLSFCIH